MKNNILVKVIAGCSLINMLFLGICFGEGKPSGAPVGTIEGTHYYPPSGIYKVIIPVDKYFGGKIDDQENSVSFTDDLCHLYRIEFTPISEKDLVDLKGMGKNKYLKEVFEKWYMPLTIWNSIKESTIDYQEYLDSLFDGALYAEVYLPKGSTCDVSTNGGTFEKADGRRGILTFISGKYAYFISVGFVAENDRSPRKAEETRKNIRDAACSFVKTIVFLQN